MAELFYLSSMQNLKPFENWACFSSFYVIAEILYNWIMDYIVIEELTLMKEAFAPSFLLYVNAEQFTLHVDMVKASCGSSNRASEWGGTVI